MTNQHRKEGMFLNADLSQDQREPPKGKGMLPHRRKSWHRWVIALGVLFLLGAPGRSYSEDPVVPFIPNPLFTTPFGPAKADIVLAPANFLRCKGGPIALCYYSGPEPASASDPDLSCRLTDDGLFANCRCLEIPYGSYFVDINAILDLKLYEKTVKKCGDDGRKCLFKRPNTAPVCVAINNRNNNNDDDDDKNALFPGADVISTFSYALNSVPGFEIGQTNCPQAVYAGCMTAPCISTKEVGMVGDTEYPIAKCACPTFPGPYQVGQDLITDPPQGPQCDLGSDLVWSAAFNPLLTGTSPSPSCFPDFPVPPGCPLLSAVPGSDPPEPIIPSPPSTVRCKKVCKEYKKSRQEDDVEVGYTCDATLCTATGKDFPLVNEACSGLQDSRISEIFKLEIEVGCSCCASQICGCVPNEATNEAIANLNQEQRDKEIPPQCDINGTLCGTEP